jgi:hypothetical protein
MTKLNINASQVHIDLFATRYNKQENLYCSAKNSTCWYDKSKLPEGDEWR